MYSITADAEAKIDFIKKTMNENCVFKGNTPKLITKLEGAVPIRYFLKTSGTGTGAGKQSKKSHKMGRERL